MFFRFFCRFEELFFYCPQLKYAFFFFVVWLWLFLFVYAFFGYALVKICSGLFT